MIEGRRRGDRDLLWGLERPVVARPWWQLALFEDRQRIDRRRGAAGVPMCAPIDPGPNRVDFVFAERVATHRHTWVIEPGNHPIQSAVFGSPGHERRSPGTSLERRLPRAKVKARELRRLSVAVPAASLHDRPDLVGKRDGLILRQDG